MAKYPGLFFAEEAALKRRLAGLFVSDDKQPERRVQVFFNHPTQETEKNYPFVTIHFIDMMFAAERALSEQHYYYAEGTGLTPEEQAKYTTIDYFPSQYGPAELDDMVDTSGFLSTESFVPIDLIYQVTTHTREMVHQNQIDALMLRRVFPLRRGFIEIPEDGTIRRLDLLDWTRSNILDQEAGQKKRIFRSVYTLQMNAEIPQADLIGLQRVTQVDHTITTQMDENGDPTDSHHSLTEDF